MPPSLSRRHCLNLAWTGLATTALPGCSFQPDADHTGPDAPQEAPLARPVRTALVLSSGGPRGFVHVGVVKALETLGLRPDLVVGSSVGSIVGVLWASGVSATQLESLALDLSPASLGRIAWGGQERFSGAAVAAWVNTHAAKDLLQHMATQVAVVCAEQTSRRVAVFTAGDAGLAVQASAAIEGSFAPVRIRGVRYVDADQVMPMPVRVARQLGASQVLAIDASAIEDRAPASAERYRAGDLRKRLLTQADATLATVTLQPDFGYWVSLSEAFRSRAIQAGYQDTMAHAARLKALFSPPPH